VDGQKWVGGVMATPVTDFLLELRSEEIPARMQDDARQNLKRLFEAELAKAGLKAEAITTYATPRRLALIAYGLPLETQAVSEELKGPKVGAPPQALEGFLRKTGLTQDQLVERDGVNFAVINKPGRATADVLAEAISVIIRTFPWPKSQRWGPASMSTESLRWVRPLQGIVALLGDDVVPCDVDGIVSGSATMGHRFHHSGSVTIGNAGDYAAKLRACHVIVDQNERENIIREGALKVSADAGLVLVQDPGLVTENAGLTEWPVPMLGRFDPAFLAVPEEVIQLTARVNQKYFVCQDAQGKLANAFVCTANIVAHDGGAAIVAGNEKVLAARLSDAKFFWEQDLKVGLEDQAKKLDAIVFHEKLGTVADKVERVAKLARWLVEEGIVKDTTSRHPDPRAGVPLSSGAAEDSGTPDQVRGDEELANMAETAARLCKADLVTGMVGEFPELQGIMGGYYARAQGEETEVADAVRDHYKPVGQGDDVPTAPVTVAVSLADKLDTIASFFAVGITPTGSKDPFALRRAALGAIRLILLNNLRVHIYGLCREPSEMLLSQLFFRLSESSSIWSEVKDTALFQDAFRLDGDVALALLTMTENEVFEERIILVEPASDLAILVADVSANLVPRNESLKEFFFERLKIQQRELGVRHDLIDAVSNQGDDLVRLLARVKALQAFVGTEDGVNLLAGYKRAANILKQAEGDKSPRHAELVSASMPQISTSETNEAWTLKQVQGDDSDVEAALHTALDTAEPLAASAILREDFEAAMTALASLRAPIDAFFEGVMVNDPDPDKRAYRLGLLTRFRDAVHRVADFSKIEG
jgi:glycyl-tRNA synthetase beta chain